MLSLSVVNGRNVWRADADAALATIGRAAEAIGHERLMIGTSCSLLHTPIDLEPETGLDPEIRSWLAFAKQKCGELRMLADAASGASIDSALASLEENREAWRSRRNSQRVTNPSVRKRLAQVTDEARRRRSPHERRKAIQQVRLNLPLFPTTTIGSLPQTDEIRAARRRFKVGKIGVAEYTAAMHGFIHEAVEHQHALGLDVLVHGEPERNDMVEYFGEQLEGFCFTKNGWVQSYGSRCVKPPFIFGDVSRPRPMTVEWTRYAQSLTDKPMKGICSPDQ